MNKPKLSPEEIITKLKNEKGITFNHISEADAAVFLRDKNNYYRLASYRKNYLKKQCGRDIGKYLNLDFAYLIDLSTIDMHLRFMIIKMCLDIEHDLKIRFLNDVSNDPDEDCYSIVKQFLQRNNYLYDDIYSKRYSTYVGDLIKKFFIFNTSESSSGKVNYDNVEVNCPAWAFVEIISFGSFIKLYEFYYDGNAPVSVSLINPIKSLRNACAHNNCIINNLQRGHTRPGHIVDVFLSKVPDISRDVRRKHMSIRPIFEFINLLIVYDRLVSANVKEHRLNELKDLIDNRMTKNAMYYEDQQLLLSSYKFVKKIVDFIA